jgi:hypothetical protein
MKAKAVPKCMVVRNPQRYHFIDLSGGRPISSYVTIDMPRPCDLVT